MNRIFLSRDGKSYGPFNQEAVDGMHARGEISSYQWIYDDPALGWRPVAAPPPAPPEQIAPAPVEVKVAPPPSALQTETQVQKIVEAKKVQTHSREWLAVLHDGRTLVSGVVNHSSSRGCVVEARAPSPTIPSFRPGTKLTLNLLDPETNQAENLKTTVDTVKQGASGWEYGLSWARAPQLATLVILFCIGLSGNTLQAAPPAAAPAQPPAAGAKHLDVDGLKEKYWNNESSPELRVVQNRTYTKEYKVSLEPFFSVLSSDPFQDILGVGVQAGFNFTEYLGVHAIYSRFWSTPSGASAAFLTAAGYGANVNPVNHLLGGEVSWSILYGKLSLIGKAILHFDLMAQGGAGYLHTNNGGTISPWLGLGQQIYIFKWMTLRADYRFAYWRENVVNLYTPGTTLGQVIGGRNVFAHLLTFGLTFLFP